MANSSAANYLYRTRVVEQELRNERVRLIQSHDSTPTTNGGILPVRFRPNHAPTGSYAGNVRGRTSNLPFADDTLGIGIMRPRVVNERGEAYVKMVIAYA